MLTQITWETLALALTLLCVGALSGLFVRRMAEGSMGASIARLTKENNELRGEVDRLRAAFDAVLCENRRWQCEVDSLKQQLSDLDKLVKLYRHDADDWRAVARSKPE